MQALPFRFEDWKRKTDAGFGARRSKSLVALDEAIRHYDRLFSAGMADPVHLTAIRDALLGFIGEEEGQRGVDAWKRGPRNQDRIIETLVTAVGLNATADANAVMAFGLREQMVPAVIAPPDIPMPPVERPTIDTSLESRALQLAPMPAGRTRPRSLSLGARSSSALSGMVRAPVAPTAPTFDSAASKVLAWVESLNTDLNKHQMALGFKLSDDGLFYQNCVNKGFNDFKALHILEANAIDFKLSLVKSAFEALKAAPFPFSTLGSIGAGVVSQFSTDQNWASLQESELPTPGGIMGDVADLGRKYKQLTTLNVRPGDLKSQEVVIHTFLQQLAAFRKAVSDGYGSRLKPLEDMNSRRALAEALASDALKKGVEPSADAHRFVTQLSKDVKGLFKDFLERPPPNLEEVAAWITVQMIADYAFAKRGGGDITSLTMKELGAKGFGDPFARFMAKPEVDVVKFKAHSGESSGIYGGGHIPWDGSANHGVALHLYLDWFREHLNPYLMLSGALHPRQIRHKSGEYIRNLGAAMMDHKKTGDAAIDAVQASAARHAKALPAGAIGGNIGDAFAA